MSPSKNQHEPKAGIQENEETIYVTSPSLPELEDFISLLEDIWQSRWITNSGPYHQKFEVALGNFFGTPHVSLVSNATLGLLIALRALDLKGKVLTTPFSFVATAHAIQWSGLEPVFCDIDERTLNLDPEEVETRITEEACAIMPVHVFGNPCDLNAFQELSDKYHLPLVYDAAHAFGVEANGKSLCVHGEFSVVSFHATKVFNTIEGGVVISRTAELKKKVDLMRNFGFTDEVSVQEVGINAKMNELQSAFGLLLLDRWDTIRQVRKNIFSWYIERLATNELFSVVSDKLVSSNYSYMPVLLPEGLRDSAYEGLKRLGFHSRRYFYPLINDFAPYHSAGSGTQMPTAEKAAQRILCLPISEYMSEENVDDICRELQHLTAGAS